MTENAAGMLVGSRGLVREIRRRVLAGTAQGVNATTIKRLAPVLNTSEEWLLTGEGPEEIDPIKSPTTQNKPRLQIRREPKSLEAFARDVPVLGTAMGSIIGNVYGTKLRGKPLQFAMRPPRLSGIPNAYAVEVSGSSMSPMFREGDVCLIDPNERPDIDRPALVMTQNYENDPGQAYIKILKSLSHNKVTLLQLNPLATIEIPREFVSSIHKILSMRDILIE